MGRILSRLAWFVLGVLLVALLMEAVLRLLPVSTGLHRTTQFARWPLFNTDPHEPYAYSIQWSLLNAHRGVTNNYGHVAPFDYRKGSRPVIVIGDSYIESLMNDYADTLQGQLARKMSAPQAVYGLGVSGLSASDYVALSRLARDEFSPSAAVIYVTDGDLSESLYPGVGNYYLVPRSDDLELAYQPVRGDSLVSRIRRTIGDVSIHRYFQVNLHFSPDALVKVWQGNGGAAPKDMPANAVNAQRRVADWFLAQLPTSLGLPPQCIALLLDADRYAIYKPSLRSTPKDSPEAKRYLAERAQALGFRVSDLDAVYRERYARDRTKFDYWPNDRHLNAVGHGVAADEAYRLLFQPGSGQRTACLPARTPGNGNSSVLAQEERSTALARLRDERGHAVVGDR
jgi:hypothetical protein